MPAKRKYELVLGQFFKWRLSRRNEVYQADGRSNQPSPGRHSLGVTMYEEAIQSLKELDVIKAVELGLADPRVLAGNKESMMDIDDGVARYLEHVQRPRMTGGASPATYKRYRTVFGKFVPFAKQRRIHFWNHVTVRLLEQYANWLDVNEYAYRTAITELTTIRQAIHWMIEQKHLPETCKINMPLKRPTGTDTYCWRPEEVEAIISFCCEKPQLHWLGDVVTALACTGMRISELVSLRWSDVDLRPEGNLIRLTDERTRHNMPKGWKARTTKNHRGRSFPIHDELRPILERLNHHAHEGRVFPGLKGKTLKADLVRATLTRDVLHKLADRFPTPAGEIGFANGRPHSFRHYFCSMCANRRVAEQVVMDWLGHHDSAMVRHYYHLHDDEAQRQMKQLTFIGAAAATVASA